MRALPDIVVSSALAAALAIPPGALEQSSNQAGHFTIIRDILEAEFPDLIGGSQPVVLTLKSEWNYEWLTGNHLVIQVLSARPPASEAVADSVALRGDFDFKNDKLDYAGLTGWRVNTSRMRTITELAEAHPEWTTRQLADALTAAGGKYGPDNEDLFKQQLRLQRFRKPLGRLRGTRIAFKWRFGEPYLGAHDIITPTWNVNVEADYNGVHSCYVLVFEPLDGHLTAIVSRSGC